MTQPITRIEVPAKLRSLATLAALLERLERSRSPVDAGQYRSVVSRLARELESADRDAPLAQLLEAFPAASELYENLQYRHAGLCRSPLDAALSAECAARAALARAASGPPPGDGPRPA